MGRSKKIILLAFFIILSLQIKFCTSYAAYDVVKATTITDEKNVSFMSDDNIQPEMYDGADFDVIESQKNDIGQAIEKKFNKIFKKKNKIDEQEDEEIEEIPIKEEANSEIQNNQIKYTQPRLQGEEVEVNEKNKFLINADEVTYNDIEGNVFAKGNVEIIAKAQGVKLKADEAVLDKTSQTLKLYNNVKIIKQGTEMKGQSLVVDLNEQNILMDNPTMEAFSFVINAQEGFLIANDVQMLNGTLKSSEKKEFPIIGRGFMRLDPTYHNNFFDKIVFPQDDSDKQKGQSYKIDSKEIVITSYKDHNSVVLKGSNVFYNDHKIVRNSDIEIISDKSRQIVETNIPEAGNLRNFGTYIGYGMLFKMPKGHTLKLMPVLAYKDSDIGIGAIARYRAKNGLVDGGWNTASENLVVRGKYQFTDGLSLNYGRNAYLPEGFMGARRSGYAAQLQYLKSYQVKDLDATFSNGVYAGIFSDYEKHDQENAYATTRFRYMAQLSKTLYKYKNKEQDFTMQLNAVSQGAATVYGSGETHGLVRIGPQLTTRFKRWEQSLGYFLSGEHGQSPFLFDLYRYGKSTISLSEKFHFNDKLALGFRLFITPMKDNYEEDFLTEARFYVIAGPKDLKVALSYDFVRDIAHLDFMFLIGSDNSGITFEKLSTKDIDGKVEKRDFYKNAKPVKIERPENI